MAAKKTQKRLKIFDYDPRLLPFEADLQLRMDNYKRKKRELVGRSGKLIDFANGFDNNSLFHFFSLNFNYKI